MKPFQPNTQVFETHIPFEGHNSLKFFEGEIISLSEDSAILKVETANLTVGEKIKLQISQQIPGYEACILECYITDKVTNKNRGWTQYHIKYTSFNQNFWLQITSTIGKAA